MKRIPYHIEIQRMIKEMKERYNQDITFYHEAGMYTVKKNDAVVGEVMNAKECYYALKIFTDVLEIERWCKQ